MTFLHRDWPASFLETTAPGTIAETTSDEVPQSTTTSVGVDFIDIEGGQDAQLDYEQHGFTFFNDPAAFTAEHWITQFTQDANREELEPGDIEKMALPERIEPTVQLKEADGGVNVIAADVAGPAIAAAFQRTAVEVLRATNGSIAPEDILVPTQAIFSRATGLRAIPHVVKLEEDQDTADQGWLRVILNNEEVLDTLADARPVNTKSAPLDKALTAPSDKLLGSFVPGSFVADIADQSPDDLLAAFTKAFDVVGVDTVWVALNETPCDNNQLALCSAASIDKENDLKGQGWYAPLSLKFGQGVVFGARRAAHVVVARDEGEGSQPRLSVECRVLVLRKKAKKRGVYSPPKPIWNRAMVRVV